MLDLIPAILRVLRMIRPKYACRGCEGTVVQAKALPRLIENSMASTALVTHVVVSKFAWFSTLVSSIADPGRSWHSSRSLDTGRLGAADSMVVERALRSPVASHPRRAIVLLRRDADAGARSREGPHQNLPVLGSCDR